MLKLIIDFVANLNVGSDILKDFIDRVYSGKKIIKYEDGTTEAVTIENAEDATVQGTPINRDAMMAVQGFQSRIISFPPNGTIIELNIDGEKKTTTFYPDGSIAQMFEGEKTITKTITFENNSIIEEIS